MENFSKTDTSKLDSSLLDMLLYDSPSFKGDIMAIMYFDFSNLLKGKVNAKLGGT